MALGDIFRGRWRRRREPRRGEPRSRLEVQIELIRESLGKDDVEVDWENGFLFQPGRILVREEYYDRAVRIIGERREPSREQTQTGEAERRPAEPAPTVIAGVRLLHLPRGVEVLRALAELERLLGRCVAAPVHYVSVADVVSKCPATEPEPVDARKPLEPARTLDTMAGRGIKVVVVDTGLDRQAPHRYRWLRGVDGEPDGLLAGGVIRQYGGHGTFIAGLVRCLAPKAEVYVRNAFQQGGAATEVDLVRVLENVLEQDSPDVISLSAGTRTYRGKGMLAFAAFNEARLRHHKGVVLVAAAGNDDSRVPFWPAAAPFAVSVGALNKRLNDRASFSNFGGWVDVYAPGVDLVNAFAVGTYTYREPGPQQGTNVAFTGLARWSGTSFATPIVAGLIAARMSHTGENGRDAAAALVKIGQAAAQSGVGAVLFAR